MSLIDDIRYKGDDHGLLRSDTDPYFRADPVRCLNSLENKDADHGIEHLGIQVETPAELEGLRGRIDRAGGTVKNEGETTCCYANSDKTWVVDAQGVSWEAFYTRGEAASYGAEA